VLCEYEVRDDPLKLDRSCDPDLIDKLSLTPKGSRHMEALSGVLACLLLAAEKERWVSYSRNHNWYVGKQRYNGPNFTHRYVVSTVDALDRFGLIENERSRPGANRWQSRMRALPVLIEAGRDCILNYRLREPLRLKDADGRLIPYKETAQTSRLRREVQSINRNLAGFQIELPGVPRSAHHFFLNGNPILLTPRPCLHRVFLRRSWQCGGRAYGWWQALPGEYRDQILLNGEAVTRPDYCALAPKVSRLLKELWAISWKDERWANLSDKDRADYDKAIKKLELLKSELIRLRSWKIRGVPSPRRARQMLRSAPHD